MAHITDRIRSSFSKIFDQAEPAPVDTLRRRCVSATQRQNIEQILADWAELGRRLHDFTFPSRRLATLLWHHGVDSIEKLPDDVQRAIERVVVEGSPHEIIRADELLRERVEPIRQRAKDAIIDLHRSLVPHLRDEIGKVTAIIEPLFLRYGCAADEIEDCAPVRKLRRSLADSESVAAGNLVFAPAHVEGELRAWL